MEDAFKQHKRSNRKFISHLGDMPHKQIKGEFEPLPQLEKLNNLASDNRNRSFSNYSLDSVDAVRVFVPWRN